MTASAEQAKDLISAHFAGSQVQTAAGLLKQLEDSVKQLNNFLVIVGLLALLIGGVGIVNTMQVLLARRRVEIAMLKTTGYQRRDLYLLFGLEAALLGLIGGILGALLGIGIAAGDPPPLRAHLPPRPRLHRRPDDRRGRRSRSGWRRR